VVLTADVAELFAPGGERPTRVTNRLARVQLSSVVNLHTTCRSTASTATKLDIKPGTCRQPTDRELISRKLVRAFAPSPPIRLQLVREHLHLSPNCLHVSRTGWPG
jgi:hypothetical protein